MEHLVSLPSLTVRVSVSVCCEQKYLMIEMICVTLDFHFSKQQQGIK